ncbi:MAG: hypothetical protein AAF184_13835 [Pseudomonadota bacterium]
MEDERSKEDTVFDFSPEGPARDDSDAARDGWAAYSRWLAALKATHRRGPRSVAPPDVNQRELLGRKGA